MSHVQIIPTRRAPLAGLWQALFGPLGAPGAACTPMGGRVIPLASATAPFWVAALLVSPLLAVGVAAVV
ncbi:MAG TPA: hypothetical protein PLF63_04265 [Rubrivivax sp.]|jgi:hypothetical protein|nr:hypothetical protein [Rubrivivax sp.]